MLTSYKLEQRKLHGIEGTPIKRPLIFAVLASLFWNMALARVVLANDEQANIQVSLHDKNGKWQIKARMKVKLSAQAFIKILDSTPDNCEWMHDCKSVTLLKEPEGLSREIATIFDSPWPFSDRLMLTKSRIEYNQDYSQVTVYVSALAPTVEQQAQDNVVLIKEPEGIWRLQKAGELSELSYIGSADADIAMPAFILKRTLLNSTMKTFENIYKISKAPSEAIK